MGEKKKQMVDEKGNPINFRTPYIMDKEVMNGETGRYMMVGCGVSLPALIKAFEDFHTEFKEDSLLENREGQIIMAKRLSVFFRPMKLSEEDNSEIDD